MGQLRQMMTGKANELEVLWCAIKEDVAPALPFTHEFPLTAMTRSVAETLWRVVPLSQAGETPRALDVGAGTGVHSLLMLARGYDVDAIDVSAEAIHHAEARVERLRCAMLQEMPVDVHTRRRLRRIRFHVSGVDEFTDPKGYDLITFNPPAYYKLRGPVTSTPAALGVFVDDDNHRDPEGAFLYRFFRRIVFRLLAPGGHLVCSWPGLERRVVEAVHGETRGRTMSPLEKLETWFDITVIGERDPVAFFNQTALVNSEDYGLHDTFWENLIAARNDYMYSGLADARRAEEHLLSFKFGVLHLVRDLEDPTLFRHVQEPPLSRLSASSAP